jgi:uncharacterized protein (DUF302 family)
MQTQSKVISIRSQVPFERCVSLLRESIMESGLEIINELAVHREVRRKLGLSLSRYTIFTAWEPLIAYQALTAEPEVSYFIPFNITVAEDGPYSVVMAPRTSLLASGSDSIGPKLMACTVENKAEQVLARVAEARLPRRNRREDTHVPSWLRRSVRHAWRVVAGGAR